MRDSAASALVLAAILLQHALGLTSVDAHLEQQCANRTVCVVIRTYWGHGSYGDNALPNLLQSLQAQKHHKWEALLVVMDNRPFPDLRHIVRARNDDRVQVFAEWISHIYQPRTDDGAGWSPDYHTKLYNLTDRAIRACPRETRWVVVTNGDNDYAADFLSELVTHEDADAVAFAYYSRYQRATEEPCRRFEVTAGAPPCKQNAMHFCQTDLGANAYSWPRLLSEGLRYGLMDSVGDSAGHDGRMAETVVNSGWKVDHVTSRCMFNHAPSPQACAQAGKVWDESYAATLEHSGGECIDHDTAQQRLNGSDGMLEMIEINVTHDGASFGMQPGDVLTVECLRWADRQHWHHAAFYGPGCVSAWDHQQRADADEMVGGADGQGETSDAVISELHLPAVNSRVLDKDERTTVDAA